MGTATTLVVTARRSCRLAAAGTSVEMQAIALLNFPRTPGVTGNTIQHIAVVPHIGTGLLQIGSVVPLAVIHWLGARRVPVNSLGGRVAIYPAFGPAVRALVIEPVEVGSAVAVELA